MRALELVRIERDGSVVDAALDLARVPGSVLPATTALYAGRGFEPPWIAYLACCDGRVVGTCAFTAPPRDARVEIAYFTFPGDEGRGVATAMARALVALARGRDPALTLVAFTRPVHGASTAILGRLGFACGGLVDHPEDGWVWEWRLGPDAGLHADASGG